MNNHLIVANVRHLAMDPYLEVMDLMRLYINLENLAHSLLLIVDACEYFAIITGHGCQIALNQTHIFSLQIIWY